jgi:hypothetical protein
MEVLYLFERGHRFQHEANDSLDAMGIREREFSFGIGIIYLNRRTRNMASKLRTCSLGA